MKKLQFVLFMVLAINISLHAQDATVAKMKFEEAEDAYNTGNYNDALNKLDEVDNLLGNVFEKSLYLRIRAFDKMIWSSGRVDIYKLSQLQKNYTQYLKTFEGKTDEDKYRDIYKISDTYIQKGLSPNTIINALAGEANDCFTVGKFYYTLKDYKSAVKFLTISADKQNPNACAMLGGLYFTGIVQPIKPDPESLFKLLTVAEKNNDWQSLVLLGIMFEGGFGGVVEDTIKAKKYFTKFVELSPEYLNKYKFGDIGRYYLAASYETGHFTEIDYAKSLQWFNLIPEYSIYYKFIKENLEKLNSYFIYKNTADNYYANGNYSLALMNYDYALEKKQDKSLNSKKSLCYLNIGDEYFAKNPTFKDWYLGKPIINSYLKAMYYSNNENSLILSKLEEAEYLRFKNSDRTNSFGAMITSNCWTGSAYLAVFPNGKYSQSIKTEIEHSYFNCGNDAFKNGFWDEARYFLSRYIYTFPTGKYITSAKKMLNTVNSKKPILITNSPIIFEKSILNNITKDKFIIKEFGRWTTLKTSADICTCIITQIDGIPVDNLSDQQLLELITGPTSYVIAITTKEIYNDGLILTKHTEIQKLFLN